MSNQPLSKTTGAKQPSQKPNPPAFLAEATFQVSITDPQGADEANEPKGKITAMATTWGPRETADGRKFFYNEKSFGAWADEFNAQDRPLPLFLNHAEQAMPAGEWSEVMITEQGMEATGQLYTNTSFGMDLMTIMMQSPLLFGGVSISPYVMSDRMVDMGGNPLPDGYEGADGYYQITSGGLREISVVMNPANKEAKVKSLEQFLDDGRINPRYLEKILREGGLKKEHAVIACKALKNSSLLREAQSEQRKAKDVGELLNLKTESDVLAALNDFETLSRLKKYRK